MFRKLSENITECLIRAAVAERQAANATDPATKQHFEQMAKNWCLLAASYKFSESLDRFVNDMNGRSPQTSVGTPLSCP